VNERLALKNKGNVYSLQYSKRYNFLLPGLKEKNKSIAWETKEEAEKWKPKRKLVHNFLKMSYLLAMPKVLNSRLPVILSFGNFVMET